MRERYGNRKKKIILYSVLFGLYSIAMITIILLSRRGGTFTLFGQEVAVGVFTGALSSFASMCLIIVAVYSVRIGYVVSLVLTIAQFPTIIVMLIRGRYATSIPGFFSNILVLTAVIMIHRRTRMIREYQNAEVEALIERQRGAEKLFEQTATALVNAIDAKDEYSRGHSQRVAEYSQRLGMLLGKSDEECKEIYYAALLHDVGKIGIADNILNKNGKLTEEEYEEIKKHPSLGKQILSGITEYPYLSIGAHFHHERYDGKGYPEKLKGSDIPEIARIISVADAYDAMSSNRSYRDAMPQQLVREEIVKGAGAQFDPDIAKAMQHLIDIDSEYKMKERREVRELSGRSELNCTEYRKEISEGIIVTPKITRISLQSIPADEGKSGDDIPSFILFDSLDGRVYGEPRMIKSLNYFEYAEIRFDGKVSVSGAREYMTDVTPDEVGDKDEDVRKEGIVYDIEAVKVRDHVSIKIDDGNYTRNVIIALPDSARFAYIAVTGQNCLIREVSIDENGESVGDDYIPRIAPLISYIEGNEGDIPNIQVDGYRTDSTEGIPVTDKMEISFHAMSLPTARLIWHCPFVNLFMSEDGKVDGKGYTELSLVRFDGENWESLDDDIKNELVVDRRKDFVGWDAWKENNKAGYDTRISFDRKADRIIMHTANQGITITNTTYIGADKPVYAALTGDQVAITDIRIHN
ncbi:MAG: HD-GYP domain-containing protein [Lachnospiraceae bacterium]|nr:HD-GYP domain-containing protein [Lachnospiraceae bacterium]